MIDRVLGASTRAILEMPSSTLRALAGPEKRNDRGALLDLQTQALLRLSEMLRFPKMHEQTPQEARASTDRNGRLVDPVAPMPARTERRFVHGPDGPIPLRVYVPRETDEPFPVLVYYHGGGFCVGSFASHDGVCRALARGGDCIVVAVDYRLAPEHPFPAAVEDAVAAFEHVAETAAGFGGDPERVAVGGDSAGANLATVVCHRQRDTGRRRPCYQLLIYPATDMTRSLPSHRLFAFGFYLDKPTKDWFVERYLRSKSDERDPLASPLFAERFDDLPPALVVTAGFDPLRDEGEAYAEKLRAAGVRVEEQREPSLVHGFINMGILKQPADARDQIARTLRRAFDEARPSRGQ